MQAVFGMTGVGEGKLDEWKKSVHLPDMPKIGDLPALNLPDMPEIGALNNAQGAFGAIYDTCMNLFKIAFGFCQVVSTLTVNLPTVPWPGLLISAWDSMSVVNFDVLGALSLDCVSSDVDFYATFVLTILYPAILLGLIVLVTIMRVKCVEGKDARAALYTQAWKFSLLGAFLVSQPHTCIHAKPCSGGNSSLFCRCIQVSQRRSSRCGIAGCDWH